MKIVTGSRLCGFLFEGEEKKESGDGWRLLRKCFFVKTYFGQRKCSEFKELWTRQLFVCIQTFRRNKILKVWIQTNDCLVPKSQKKRKEKTRDGKIVSKTKKWISFRVLPNLFTMIRHKCHRVKWGTIKLKNVNWLKVYILF